MKSVTAHNKCHLVNSEKWLEMELEPEGRGGRHTLGVWMYYCSYIFTPFSDHSSGKLERNPVWIYCLTESHFNHRAINSLLLGFYPVEKSWSCMQSSFIYRALKKYSQSLEFSNFCHCTKKNKTLQCILGFYLCGMNKNLWGRHRGSNISYRTWGNDRLPSSSWAYDEMRTCEI